MHTKDPLAALRAQWGLRAELNKGHLVLVYHCQEEMVAQPDHGR